MGASVRPASLPFLRHDDIASCRGDFEHYRREGFPVYSLKRDEKRQELLDLLVAEHAGIIDQTGRIKQTMHGLALAWHYQPLAWSIRCGNRKTPIELFSDDMLFLKAIERRTKLGHAFSDGGLRKILRTFSSTQSVSNFRPTAAAAVYHRLLPENGVVWDMSSGFGGRLLGAIACDKVDRYVGTDPSTYAMDGLREMAAELVPMAEQLGRRTLEVELHQTGSEDFLPGRNSLDLCFSSPPFGPGHEKYSDEPSQSYKKFPTQREWLHGFIGATLRNCAHGLKKNGILAINIANVAAYPNLARVFLRYAEGNGWQLVEKLQLQMSKMVGLKHIGSGAFKTEPIYVFKRHGK